MRYEPISSSLFAAHRHAFVKQMKKNSMAIFFSNDAMPRSGDQTFPFRQDPDLYALSGLNQPGTILVLNPGASDQSMREFVFILSPDPLLTVWNGKRYSKMDARKLSGIQNVYTLGQWSRVMIPLLESAKVIYLNAALTENPLHRVLNQNERRGVELQNDWPKLTFLSARPLLQKQMMIKHSIEIELMKKAISVTGKAFEEVLKVVRPGLREFEVEAELTREIIRSGCQNAFEPIIASGKSACTLHYTRNDGVLRSGTLVLLDFGAEYAGMASDMSRTIPVSGRFTKRQREVYVAVWEVLNEVMDMMRPGITIAELNAETGKLMDSALIRLKLLTRQDLRSQDPAWPLRKKYFMHGVSHHLGWDVHDKNEPDAELKPGMILTCEPGLYLSKEKTGIRLENDILISRGAPINLMKHIPIDPDEIEGLMNR
jgi:Xaa-Pro aminopeptidase